MLLPTPPLPEATAITLLTARPIWPNLFGARSCSLPALVVPEAGEIKPGDELHIDASAGKVVNRTSGKTYACEPIPDHLMAMIADGGLMAHLKKRIDAGEI